MKLTEIRPLDDRGARPDRLSPILVGAAMVLVALASALVADLWLQPSSGSLLAGVTGSIGAYAGTESSVLARSMTATPEESRPVLELAAAELVVLDPITPPPCERPAGWTAYTVLEGDTLASVAESSGVAADTLVEANCLNTGTLFIGQGLYVPGQRIFAPTPTTMPAPTLVPPPSPTEPPTAVELPAPEEPTAVPPTSTQAPAATETATLAPTAALTLTTTAETGLLAQASPAERLDATPTLLDEAALQATATSLPALATPLATPTPKSAFRVNVPNRYLNIILLGSDKRPGWRAWRTDTMIILSIDVETNVVRLLSIPRDLWVYIPGHGYNRVNTAELWGELHKKGTGTERIKQTIHHNLGIPIHYYARVDFYGFVKIVDTVGGVDIDVDCPLPDIDLKPGMHHMNGKQALRYARSRKSTSDFDRGRRQRKVLMALWDQALTMEILPKLPELWVTMADNFETDLPLDQVINLAYLGVQLNPEDIHSKSIRRKDVKGWRTPQGAAVLVPREDRIRALLEDYYAPKERANPRSSDKVGVQILNGWSRRDADQLAADNRCCKTGAACL